MEESWKMSIQSIEEPKEEIIIHNRNKNKNKSKNKKNEYLINYNSERDFNQYNEINNKKKRKFYY